MRVDGSMDGEEGVVATIETYGFEVRVRLESDRRLGSLAMTVDEAVTFAARLVAALGPTGLRRASTVAVADLQRACTVARIR
jgi:hypothetical protein